MGHYGMVAGWHGDRRLEPGMPGIEGIWLAAQLAGAFGNSAPHAAAITKAVVPDVAP